MAEPFEPEDQEEVISIEDFKEKYPFAYEMEMNIATAFQTQNVKAADLLMLIRNLMARSRAILTFDEMHQWVHKLMNDAEYLLQTGQAFVQEDGTPINMMLAEEREETGAENFDVPDTVPEDWA